MADSIPYVPTRIRKPGDLKNNQRKCWHGILVVNAILLDPASNRSTKLRAATTLAKLCHTYKDILLGSDMEKRIEAIEETIKNLK